jgi:hypothetical protein
VTFPLDGLGRNLVAFGGPHTSCQPLPHLLAASSLERDFRRRRLARKKGPEGDVSAQRLEIGDHHTREMAAKRAFLLASCQLRVSEDWQLPDQGQQDCSQHAVQAHAETENGEAIQLHGGFGFTDDFAASRLYRGAR